MTFAKLALEIDINVWHFGKTNEQNKNACCQSEICISCQSEML